MNIFENAGLFCILITVLINLIQFNTKISDVVKKSEFMLLYDKLIVISNEQEKLKTLIDEHLKKVG